MSRRDCVTKPRVARHELPWVKAQETIYLGEVVAASVRPGLARTDQPQRLRSMVIIQTATRGSFATPGSVPQSRSDKERFALLVTQGPAYPSINSTASQRSKAA
jgi:hypothetical protein